MASRAAAEAADAASSPLSSWLPVSADSDFPIQNLPYGVFTTASQPQPHIGVAIGEHVLDLHVMADAGAFSSAAALHVGGVFKHPTLNAFMALERPQWLQARALITELLSESASASSLLRLSSSLRDRALLPQSSVTMQLPAAIGDYTDFYASRNHAYNLGVMFRGPENALQPNYLHLPVGYHGRSSSIVISGTDIHRPRGQTMKDGDSAPALTASRVLDFELEVGVFVGGKENALGHPVSLQSAMSRMFGLVLLNDWSARDVQRWEYVPLGPFTAKNFASSISPWVVTFDALEQARIPLPQQSPTPLPYLLSSPDVNVAYDIELGVQLTPSGSFSPAWLSRSNTSFLYWSFQQMLTHHTVTGCNLRAGDLLGSGTISGTEETQLGSMIEMSSQGKKEVDVGGGEKRKFLQDGDEVCMTATVRRPEWKYQIGFGQCRGRILPALDTKDWL